MAQELRDQIRKDYLDTWWNKFKFWFLVRKVYRAKIKALWEANLDKLFFESQYNDDLEYDDSADRSRMAAERKKPLDQQDQIIITEAEEKISHAKAIKDSYNRNERFRDEVKTYILMLELWMNKNPNSDS